MRRRSEFNWMELLEGVLLILLGIFSFIRPGSALTGVVMLYGFIAMITGIVDIVLYVRIERHTGFGPTISLVSGILSVMAGVMLLIYPGTAEWVISIMLPVWFIAHCVSRLAHIGMLRKRCGEGFRRLNGSAQRGRTAAVSCCWIRPFADLAGIYIGFCLILLGAESVARAFERRKYL